MTGRAPDRAQSVASGLATRVGGMLRSRGRDHERRGALLPCGERGEIVIRCATSLQLSRQPPKPTAAAHNDVRTGIGLRR